MDKNIIETAASVIQLSYEETEAHCKEVPEIEGWYFWNPIRGGISVLINAEGEKLAASSAVSFEKHLKAFLDGKRN